MSKNNVKLQKKTAVTEHGGEGRGDSTKVYI